MSEKRYPVLSGYSNLIYKMISDHLRPIEAHMDTELQTLGWCAGIEHDMQYWNRAMLEEVADERIRERLLKAWDQREKVRERESAAYYEAEALAKDDGDANTEAHQIIEYMIDQITKAIDQAGVAMKTPGRPSYAHITNSMRSRLVGLRIDVQGWQTHGVAPEYMDAFLAKHPRESDTK